MATVWSDKELKSNITCLPFWELRCMAATWYREWLMTGKVWRWKMPSSTGLVWRWKMMSSTGSLI